MTGVFSGAVLDFKYLCCNVFVAAADVDTITRNMDFNALQENIMNITFCSIESEVVCHYLLITVLKDLQIHSQTYLYTHIMNQICDLNLLN